MPFYAVARGRCVGIYYSWRECEPQVTGFSNARFRKFDSYSEAEDFLSSENGDSDSQGSRKRSYESSSGSGSEYSEPQSKRCRNGFTVDDDGYVVVYTDGACFGNGTYGARAGIGVWWGDYHYLNVSEPVRGRSTNIVAELEAAIQAMSQALDNGITLLAIHTDSLFLIKAVTLWMPSWIRNGWLTKNGNPVRNETEFREIDRLQNELQDVKWVYVPAHQRVHGNEMADKLAKAGAALYN